MTRGQYSLGSCPWKSGKWGAGERPCDPHNLFTQLSGMSAASETLTNLWRKKTEEPQQQRPTRQVTHPRPHSSRRAESQSWTPSLVLVSLHQTPF